MVLQENGNGEGAAVDLGRNNKYRRIDSEFVEDYDASQQPHQEKDRAKTKKYVLACAFFASLNSVLLGYGMLYCSALTSSCGCLSSGYFNMDEHDVLAQGGPHYHKHLIPTKLDSALSGRLERTLEFATSFFFFFSICPPT